MGMTEKQSLINSITLQLAEDYNLIIKEVRAKVTEIMQQYHVTLSKEPVIEGDTSTEYLMQKFYEGKTAAGMSVNTLKQYGIAVSRLEEYSKKSLCDIEPEDINNFLRRYSEKVSSVTVKAKYQYLSSVYNYLFNHSYISYNPILYIDTPKSTVVYKKPMSDTDLEKLKYECEKLTSKEGVRDSAIIYTFVSTGCRVAELANIKIKDVDFENKICKVMGKGRKERPVILDEAASFRLQLYLKMRKNKDPDAPLFAHIRGEEKAVSKDGIECIIRKLRNTAGLDNITCHSFRRYNATELRKRNVNIQMIASYLGHANLNQINRYSLYNSNEMLNMIRKSM